MRSHQLVLVFLLKDFLLDDTVVITGEQFPDLKYFYYQLIPLIPVDIAGDFILA